MTMNITKIDRTIKPGDLVKCERYGQIHGPAKIEGSNIAVVVKIDSGEVFADKDNIVHLLFAGSDTKALAMLSSLTRINPVNS